MNKLNVQDRRWLTYSLEPDSDSYKGYRLKGSIKTEPGKAMLNFTNGDHGFEVFAESAEDAFVNASDIIDNRN